MPRKIDRPENKQAWGRYIEYTSPTGEKTVLSNIGVVANAIGRTSQTVRKWEVAGIIPPSPFKQGNKRLYAQEHVDILVEGVEKYHVCMGQAISPYFKRFVYKEFQKINDKFFGEVKNYGDEES